MEFFWITGAIARRILGGIVGIFVKSPLEEDFGESDPEALAPPPATWIHRIPVPDAPRPLAQMFARIDGLSGENVEKIGLRMTEIPVGRSAVYRYQVSAPEEGATELHLVIEKHPGGITEIKFTSSNEVIELIQGAFGMG